MKRVASAWLLLLGVTLALTPTAQAQSLLLDYVGFDYESPDPNPSEFGEVGAGYNGLGDVPLLFSPLSPDTSANEYTYYMTGLTVSSRTPVGDFLIIDYAGPGSMQIHEDSRTTGTHRDFGINPPNATAPPTFTDGTLFLEGTLTAFQIIVNTTTGTGSFEGVFEATGGSELASIPVDQRTGWTFSGVTENDLGTPEGYTHQVDGQIFLNAPLPVEPTTWGRLKSLR